MYDAGGNITQKCEYAYTTGNLVNATALDTIAYGYTDANWPDLLTSYDGQEITSDGIGNMLYDGMWTYNWQHGCQLTHLPLRDRCDVKGLYRPIGRCPI